MIYKPSKLGQINLVCGVAKINNPNVNSSSSLYVCYYISYFVNIKYYCNLVRLYTTHYTVNHKNVTFYF